MRYLLPLLILAACSAPDAETSAPAPGVTPPDRTAYAEDVAFLKSHDPNLVLLSDGNASVATSAKYQGKVFTSTATGAESFGYLAYDVFEAENPDPHINGYGGENRLWLGPEGGPLSIFFDAGAPYTGEHWYVPPAIDREPWDLVSRDSASVVFAKAAQLKSRKGTAFDVRLDREVMLMTPGEIAESIDVQLPTGLEVVAYHTDNRLTNTGAEAWTREAGTVCLWALDMLPASDSAVVIYPLAEASTVEDVRPYFGNMDEGDRMVVGEVLLFRGDGSKRTKVGLSPKLATGTGGSLDLARGTLTVVRYDVRPREPYLGMEWEELADPYDGDAATTYNDPGPDTFYEIESIGEAAFLTPGASTQHGHTVYHFTGDGAVLAEAAEALLGVDVADVRAFLRGG